MRTPSDLISEDSQGDLAVLPHGRVTPELFCLLRALCAPASEFDRWGRLADVLQGSATGSGGGGARASGARTVGGVPLASLLSDFGGGGDGGGAGGGACVDGEDQPRQADAVTARFQEVAIGGEAAALWSHRMGQVLLAAISERQARYPPGSCLEGDARELARLGAGDRSERAAAVRGALQLRVVERTLLQQAERAAAALRG
ncbi:hypothetical protein MNEG_16371 [Monoraphidium neglectum]|uniref:Rubisco LSMT substrate-binding domain-containing protein n=1 Tax=Monoraphidium neglectum TaxID=145388 RepID=A0A0D2K620_9CHLO|nr:hypothetical protein MNEG_16371 [Monoraphidium neglectum]KIY91593.1 hypothetical protein MNEG_16371 [Monoraphidium neglectum]|eukprot:XP_013890613.1 hypothetical protein MNEG_16371 [Monoraphidium neglectum]